MSAVLTAAPAARLTPDDLLKMPDEGRGFELVNGELKELNVSLLSSFVAGKAYFQLESHVTPRQLGWVFPEGTSSAASRTTRRGSAGRTPHSTASTG